MKLYKLGSWLRWLANRIDPPPLPPSYADACAELKGELDADIEREILRTAVGNVEVPAHLTPIQRKRRLATVPKSAEKAKKRP